jgi:hypothetical protein
MKNLKSEQPIENKAAIYKLVPTHIITVKDNYLPNALVKAGLFKNNAEARNYIRTEGVMLNGKLNKNNDATNHSSNFEVDIDSTKYQFFVV